MIDLTERQLAQHKINDIKEVLNNSNVDYYICETPYKLSLNLRKRFLKDSSPKISSSEHEAQSSITSPKELSSPIRSNASLLSSLNDSGNLSRGKNCMSCEESEKVLDDTRKELVKNIMESKQTIKDLEEKNAEKDSMITRLENELEIAAEEINRAKSERNTKIEQLKQKNKVLDKMSSSVDTLKADHERTQNNFTNKIKNLENVIKNLNSKLGEKTQELKSEKLKVKKLESNKINKSKTKSTQTDDNTKVNFSQTTFSSLESVRSGKTKNIGFESKNVGTIVEDKYLALLKDSHFSDVYFKAGMRSRSKSVPARSKVKIKQSTIVREHTNPKEAPWDDIEPGTTVANVLNLTRDITGFYCATASNMKRIDLIEEMMIKMINCSSRAKIRIFKTAKRKAVKKDSNII